MRALIVILMGLAYILCASSHIQAQNIMSNTDYQTPVIVLGTGEQPAVMVLGGVHGNEPAGAVAAQSLANKKVVKGTLIVIPRVNKLALERNIRTLGSIGDVNRQYNEQKSYQPAKQIAQEIMILMEKYKVKMLIDMHEALDYNKLNKNSLGQLILPSTNDKSAILALDAVEHINKTIIAGYEKFGYGPYPVKNSAAYYAGKKLNIIAFTVETSSKNKLEERVRQHSVIAEYLINAEGVVLE